MYSICWKWTRFCIKPVLIILVICILTCSWKPSYRLLFPFCNNHLHGCHGDVDWAYILGHLGVFPVKPQVAVHTRKRLVVFSLGITRSVCITWDEKPVGTHIRHNVLWGSKEMDSIMRSCKGSVALHTPGCDILNCGFVWPEPQSPRCRQEAVLTTETRLITAAAISTSSVRCGLQCTPQNGSLCLGQLHLCVRYWCDSDSELLAWGWFSFIMAHLQLTVEFHRMIPRATPNEGTVSYCFFLLKMGRMLCSII